MSSAAGREAEDGILVPCCIPHLTPGSPVSSSLAAPMCLELHWPPLMAEHPTDHPFKWLFPSAPTLKAGGPTPRPHFSDQTWEVYSKDGYGDSAGGWWMVELTGGTCSSGQTF